MTNIKRWQIFYLKPFYFYLLIQILPCNYPSGRQKGGGGGEEKCWMYSVLKRDIMKEGNYNILNGIYRKSTFGYSIKLPQLEVW